MRQPIIFFVALMSLIFFACEHKDVPQPADPKTPGPTTPASKYFWSINGTVYPLDSAFPKPFRVPLTSFETVGPHPDSSGVIVQYCSMQMGSYTFINHADYYNLLWPPKNNAYITLTEGGKKYRNYKQPQKNALKVGQPFGRSIDCAGVWLYNAADYNDSVHLQFHMDAGLSSGNSSWSINGDVPRTASAKVHSIIPFHNMTYNIGYSYISLSFLSKPSASGNYRFGISGWNKILLNFRMNNAPQSGYYLDQFYIKELDTNQTAEVTLLQEGIQVSFRDKVVLTAPVDTNFPNSPPGVYPDTFRISATLRVSKDW